MEPPEQTASDHHALSNLVVNCPDLRRLEALLGGFNLFQVLKFEHGEIRHSNVLAWLLDPAESHGLGDAFLKKWLMRVTHERGDAELGITPMHVDSWRLLDVEIRREWKHIDVFAILTFVGGERWVFSIENKIRSTQHTDQLKRYRSVVEREFPIPARCAKQLFVFLTVEEESPEDINYVCASYGQVRTALIECIEERKGRIGAEPLVLMENYVRLIEEKFMDNSNIAELARRIYRQHRRALDIIFEHRPDNIMGASDAVRGLLKEKERELGIRMDLCTKMFVRFVPTEWDIPENRNGTAWSGSNRVVLCEIKLRGSQPRLAVVAGKPPLDWIRPLWDEAAKQPFNRQNREKMGTCWVQLHTAGKVNVSLDEDAPADATEVGLKIVQETEKWLRSPDTREVIARIAAHLKKLPLADPAEAAEIAS